MKIGDFLYFAPDVPFGQVDLTGEQLPEQYAARIEGYYLAPAALLADSGHGFASGLLVLTAIDAIARLARNEPRVGPRIKAWLRDEIEGLPYQWQIDELYDNVRNGLVHEARLKDGAEFSLDQDRLADDMVGMLRINPRLLLNEVRDALSRFVTSVQRDDVARAAFLERIRQEFVYELQGLRGALPCELSAHRPRQRCF